MTPKFSTQRFSLYQGDCLEVMRGMADSSVDSIVTDPPYGLSFMGKDWDHQVPGVAVWREALRVLKPGGHLLAFGGSRTYHRMAVAIEDAGFEIRDQIMWIYGSGFPKSLDVSKAIDKAAREERQVVGRKTGRAAAPVADLRGGNLIGEKGRIDCSAITAPATEAAKKWQGWGTALKPAHEPICVARKPLIGTVAENVLAHRTGAINIDACRVEPTGESRPRDGEASHDRRYASKGGTDFAAAPGVRGGDPAGRFPANVIHDGSDEVLAVFPDAPGQMARARMDGQRQKNVVFGSLRNVTNQAEPRGDVGSAARFFYCAKASRADRNSGLASSDKPAVGTNATMREREDANWSARNGNSHPTVKPTVLMAYLCRLVTPPGGVVLDPFMGSGSTGKACMAEELNFIGIELDKDAHGNPLGYLEIAHARIERALSEAVIESCGQLRLWEGAA